MGNYGCEDQTHDEQVSLIFLMIFRPFQTGSRNTSHLMNTIVKHVEVDITQLS